jgi:hypothetical protein
MLNRAAFVMNAFGVKVSGMGLFWAFKTADCVVFAVKKYLCQPSFSSFVPSDAKQSRAFIAALRSSLILEILASAYISQIAKRVVGSIAINMVDIKCRPLAGHIQPRKAVRPVAFPIDKNKQVAFAVVAPNNGFRALNAQKLASFGIVVKKFAQTLRGKIGLSHEAPVKRIGQRPVSVSSTCGLRYFSVGGA